jgi:hypothetical protein
VLTIICNIERAAVRQLVHFQMWEVDSVCPSIFYVDVQMMGTAYPWAGACSILSLEALVSIFRALVLKLRNSLSFSQHLGFGQPHRVVRDGPGLFPSFELAH